MDSGLSHILYSKNVLEFVTVASEYISFTESANEQDRQELLTRYQKLLPLLYLKASLLPSVENQYSEIVEKFCAENDWNFVESVMKNKLGAHNDYLEVFDPDMAFSEGPLPASISENLADIYQETKDFVMNYGIGTTEIMNDALWECKENFEQHWGQKLLNALRAIHLAIYTKNALNGQDEIEGTTETQQNLDTRNWIIARMQREYRKENDEE
jgi:hypothetical protein